MSNELPQDLQTMDASELGKVIGRTTKTVREDSRRRPETLPPRLVIPGSKKLLWRVVDVQAWLQALADVEQDRRDRAVKAVKRAGLKPDFGFRPFALANVKNGRNARKRMDGDKQ